MTAHVSEREYDLLIIGGGPAGLTAAAYAIRKRIEAILVSEDIGGKTNYKFSLPQVDTHIILDGEELLGKFKSQIEYLDFARHLAKVTKFQKTGERFLATTADRTFKAKAAIIATGVMPRRLKVPGEQKFLGRGVSYSAISHAPLFIDLDVAVVGDGIPAMQAAAELVRIAGKVNVIGVPKSQLSTSIGRRIQVSGRAEFFSDYKVREIQGDASIERITIYSKKSEVKIPVSGVFIELGYTPNTSMFAGLVKRNRDGRIMVDENNQASIPGLFAAGDVTDVNANQVIIAMGEGANAALSAYNYLLSIEP